MRRQIEEIGLVPFTRVGQTEYSNQIDDNITHGKRCPDIFIR